MPETRYIVNFRAMSDIRADSMADAERIAQRIEEEIYAFTSVTEVVVTSVAPKVQASTSAGPSDGGW